MVATQRHCYQRDFWGKGGLKIRKPIFLKESTQLNNLTFSGKWEGRWVWGWEGEKVQNKKPSLGEVRIFSRTTQFMCSNTVQLYLSLPLQHKIFSSMGSVPWDNQTTTTTTTTTTIFIITPFSTIIVTYLEKLEV